VASDCPAVFEGIILWQEREEGEGMRGTQGRVKPFGNSWLPSEGRGSNEGTEGRVKPCGKS